MLACFLLLFYFNSEADVTIDCQGLFWGKLTEKINSGNLDSVFVCIEKRFDNWYVEPYDNTALISFLASAYALNNKRFRNGMNDIMNNVLANPNIDDRVKCAILIHFKKTVNNITKTVRNKRLIHLTAFIKRGSCTKGEVDSAVSVLNRSNFDEVVFVVDNVAYIKNIGYKDVLGRINVERFENVLNANETYSKRDILQTAIDAAFGELENSSH